MALTADSTGTRSWQSAGLGEAAAAAELDALGTRVRVAVWPAGRLEAACAAVGAELRRLDLEASRFREDSEIARLHARGGGLFLISEGLAEAIGVALVAARWTEGLVDPTIGNSLVELGYDRDFAAMLVDGSGSAEPGPAPGFGSIQLEGRLLRMPLGVLLDLGATAKGLGADRAALAALAACGRPGGVLVSLGGDIAVAGEPPLGGWPLLVTESSGAGEASPSQIVRLPAGAIATSSVTVRQWRRDGRALHHIIDPRTGLPAEGPWRTATVAAASCSEANAASTAALVSGGDAVAWLESSGLPARLVASNGAVEYVGAWPQSDGGLVEVPGRCIAGLGPRPKGRSI